MTQRDEGQTHPGENLSAGEDAAPLTVSNGTIEDRLRAVDQLLSRWRLAEEFDPDDLPEASHRE